MEIRKRLHWEGTKELHNEKKCKMHKRKARGYYWGEPSKLNKTQLDDLNKEAEEVIQEKKRKQENNPKAPQDALSSFSPS